MTLPDFPRAWTAYRRAAYLTGPSPRRQFLPREVLLGLLRQVEERLPLLDAPDLPWALAGRVHDAEYLRRWRAGLPLEGLVDLERGY